MTADLLPTHTLFLIRTGSHLYGTSRPESDEDFAGVFLPTAQHILGLDNVDELDLSVESRSANGRNDGDAVDRVYHDVRKFSRALLKGSPNFLEMMYAHGENVVENSIAGTLFRQSRDRFLHVGLANRFVGYAQSQLKKMYLRTRDRAPMERAVDALESVANLNRGRPFRVRDLAAEQAEPGIEPIDDVIFDDFGIRIGDSQFKSHVKITDVVKRMRAGIELAKSDERTFSEFGFDTKYGSHLLRLLYEGIDLVTNGELVFPLPQAAELLAVRRGEWTAAQVQGRSEELLAELYGVIDGGKSPLPDEPDRAGVDRLIQHMLHDHLIHTFSP